MTPVFKSYEISENGQILRIQNVQLADSGQYKCLVTNAVGTDSTTFNVETFTPPQIQESESTKNMTGLAGETDWCFHFRAYSLFTVLIDLLNFKSKLTPILDIF